MSELKLISPLLDGFMMGDPISSHDGVRCCPAMKENSDDKYIVKIISVPASQKQLDALLLTGAYKDASAAAEYFKGLAEDTVKEARLLQQLAKLEGFLSYEGWQIVPMEGDEVGFDIYLLGSYKRSLEKFLRRNTMTHLNAVNLGIDLCAALALCRRAGFIYTDLKPANIYISGQQEYRIGDLGFAKLNAMKYTSMPSKYTSRYTPPELHDPFATLNPTVDTYAVGMILYQIYNHGDIPFATKAPLRTLPAPLNADYEMAEIILKACDPNPRKRYQTPIEMGQALVSYMQRNSVNDVPIVPPTVESIPADSIATQDEIPQVASSTDDAITVKSEIPEETPIDATEELPEELRFMEDLVSDDTAPGADENDDLVDAQTSDEVDQILAQADELISHGMDIPVEIEETEEQIAEELEETVEENAEEVVEEEVEAEIEEAVEESPETVSEEVMEIPADLQETVDEETETESDEDGMTVDFNLADSEEKNADDIADDELDFGLPAEDVGSVPSVDGIEEDDDFFTEASPRKKHSWIGLLVSILILALLIGGGYYYYSNLYQLHIENMSISSHESSVTVELTTQADEDLLKIVCTDTYGNKYELPVTNGKAVFDNLNPDTTYKFVVETNKIHKVTGSFTGSYTTAEVTTIVDFSAKAGSEDGSVILNFTVDGPELPDWTVEYTAEGEEAKSVTFSGHMATINNLAIGKNYTFTLVPTGDLYLTGNTTLEHLATKVIIARNLSIVSCENGVLTAQWYNDEETPAESWSVRCYAENGYDETIIVTDTVAQFDNISADQAYTVEVTAVGMSQSARAFVTANPAVVSDVQVSYEAETGLTISWVSDIELANGWLVMFRVDGSNTTELAQCTGTTAIIKHVIPEASYQFQIAAVDGTTVFGGTAEFAGIEKTAFYNHALSATSIQSSLCRTPDKDGWTHEDVSDSSYTTSYAVGESASLVLYTSARFYLEADDTAVMFVIRNAEGEVIPSLTRTVTKGWLDLWPGVGKYCYLDIPVMPTVEGQYSIEVYFDGGTVLEKNFSIITTNG